MSGVLVARPKRGRLGACRVCALSREQRQEVNEAIWDGTTRRSKYREAGKRVFEALSGESINVKAITRHAEHIEDSWREATVDDPAAGREEPVFQTDYESLTERAAAAGARAMSALERRIAEGGIGDRELVGVAKLGLEARQKQRALEQQKERPEIALLAIIGLASGHLQPPPEQVTEVIDVSTLKEEVQAQRRQLEARAGGDG